MEVATEIDPDRTPSPSPDAMDADEADLNLTSIVPMNDHLWGFLTPCNPNANFPQIDFWRINPIITIGRDSESNCFTFPGHRISANHCTFQWNGNDGAARSVVLTDTSTSGTFVNGVRISKGGARIVRDGMEIAFGSPDPQLDNNGIEDYRYIFRHVDGLPPMGAWLSYDKHSQIGRGAHAYVYRVMDIESGAWYAAKVITPSKMFPVSMAKREIEIMKSLKHPNVTQIWEYFVFEGDDTITLIVDFIEGGDLHNYVNKVRDGLSEGDTKDIAFQIFNAMAYIHNQGIIHRDLKPDNILLTRDDPPIVKIADFGVSKFTGNDTLVKSFCGTRAYIAPEVVAADVEIKGYTNRVDSFSIGGIIYYCLTLSVPYTAPKKYEVAQNGRVFVKNRKRDLTSLRAKQLSAEVMSLVVKLLNFYPRRRPSVRDALAHAWFAGHTPAHAVLAAAYKANKASKRHAPLHMIPEEDGANTTSAAAPRSAVGKKKGAKKRVQSDDDTSKDAPTAALNQDGDSAMVPATPLRRSPRENKGVNRMEEFYDKYWFSPAK